MRLQKKNSITSCLIINSWADSGFQELVLISVGYGRWLFFVVAAQILVRHLRSLCVTCWRNLLSFENLPFPLAAYLRIQQFDSNFGSAWNAYFSFAVIVQQFAKLLRSNYVNLKFAEFRDMRGINSSVVFIRNHHQQIRALLEQSQISATDRCLPQDLRLFSSKHVLTRDLWPLIFNVCYANITHQVAAKWNQRVL